MANRPVRIQMDYDPQSGRFVSGDAFHCAEGLNAITGDPVAGDLIKQSISEATHASVFSAINAAFTAAATDQLFAALAAQYEAQQNTTPNS